MKPAPCRVDSSRNCLKDGIKYHFSIFLDKRYPVLFNFYAVYRAETMPKMHFLIYPLISISYYYNAF